MSFYPARHSHVEMSKHILFNDTDDRDFKFKVSQMLLLGHQ